MSTNPSAQVQNTEDGFPNYPGFGEPDDVLARIRGGFLDGRRLLAEPDPIAPFGQKWTLEEP